MTFQTKFPSRPVIGQIGFKSLTCSEKPQNFIMSKEMFRGTLYCTVWEEGRQQKKVFNTLRFNTNQVPDAANPGQFIQQQESNEDYDTVVRKHTEYFIPKRNIIHERLVFQERAQKQEETVEEFLRDLQSLVKTCEYRDEEDQVRDRFVVGLRDSHIKQKLQLKADPTLSDAITLARQHEQVKQQMAAQHATPQEVNETHAKKFHSRPKPPHKTSEHPQQQSQDKPRSQGQKCF
jgi:hypothetical protein